MSLIENIKKSEGFVGVVYKDSLGIDTIGYGTKLPIDEDEAELLLNHRLTKKRLELTNVKPVLKTLSRERQDVLFEMVYQMGVGGVLLFKKMWEAIEADDYFIASLEMLSSKWAKQTPLRAKRLSNIMRG